MQLPGSESAWLRVVPPASAGAFPGIYKGGIFSGVLVKTWKLGVELIGRFHSPLPKRE